MKSVWNGAISFGLVNIPVKLVPAVKSQTISFRLLHSLCKTPLEYKRYCPKDEVEVEWTDVEKGLELSKGSYYVLTKEELSKIRPEKTDTIDVSEFVDACTIDSIYFDKHYYIVPAKSKEKAYFLFKRVLEDSGKAGIARFVMRDRVHTCTIESYKNGLLLNTLNYEYEINDTKEIEELKEAPALSAEELKLAKQLIEKHYAKTLDLKQYKDTFIEELKKAIKRKEGAVISLQPKKKERVEKNLLDALKESLK